MNARPFIDRREAGERLAEELDHLAGRPDVIVLALPRGGVPVAFEVAKALRQPLELFIVRKLGLPGHEEYAMGAIASGGVRWVNPDVVAAFDVSPEDIDAVTRRESAELARREAAYRRGRPATALAGKTLVLVDDGIATGATVLTAISALRQLGPARVIVAAPVIAAGALDALRSAADEVECLIAPVDFVAVGRWYRDFDEVTDAEVIGSIDRAAAMIDAGRKGADLRTGILSIVCATALLTAACFAYRPVNTAPEPGSQVRMVLVTATEVTTVDALGDRRPHPGVLEVHGRIVATADDTIAVRLGELRTSAGAVPGLEGRTALLPAPGIARIERHRFQAGTTALAGIGVATLAVGAFLIVVIVSITKGF